MKNIKTILTLITSILLLPVVFICWLCLVVIEFNYFIATKLHDFIQR